MLSRNVSIVRFGNQQFNELRAEHYDPEFRTNPSVLILYRKTDTGWIRCAMLGNSTNWLVFRSPPFQFFE